MFGRKLPIKTFTCVHPGCNKKWTATITLTGLCPVHMAARKRQQMREHWHAKQKQYCANRKRTLWDGEQYVRPVRNMVRKGVPMICSHALQDMQGERLANKITDILNGRLDLVSR